MDLVCLNFSQFITVSLSNERVMDSQSVVKTSKDNSSHSHPMFNISPTENQSTDDAEISIFEAHKYFSQDIKSQGKKPSHDLLPCVERLSSVSSSVEGYGRSKSLCDTTPTASSETSWNSRTGLLSNPPGVSLKNLASSCTTRRWSAARKWFSRRNCCCTGENSVGVREVTQESEHKEPIVLIDSMKSSNRNLHRDGDQITDNVVEIHHIKAMATASSSSMDAPSQQRISATGRPFTDAFTFPILSSSSDQPTSPPSLKAIVAKSTVNPLENAVMESFQPVLSLSSMENHGNARGPSIAREDDVGSDCSSDLFEIESFSTQSASCPMQMHCWWDSVDENLQHSRPSVEEVAAADGCNRETEQTREQRKATVVKCVAEGPPLHVKVPPSSPLSVASMA